MRIRIMGFQLTLEARHQTLHLALLKIVHGDLYYLIHASGTLVQCIYAWELSRPSLACIMHLLHQD